MQVYDETEPDSADKPVLGEKGRRYRKVNWMKGAFLSADKLLTVSPTYAEEIAANESQGVELDNVIRYCGLVHLGASLCDVPAIYSDTLCSAKSLLVACTRLGFFFVSAAQVLAAVASSSGIAMSPCQYVPNDDVIGLQHGKAQLDNCLF